MPPPDFLRDEGDAILHLDRHPANVMLAARGPEVIDWANAARATLHWMALTAVVLAGAPVGPPLSWLRDRFDRAVAYRRADGNVSDKEKKGLTSLRL